MGWRVSKSLIRISAKVAHAHSKMEGQVHSGGMLTRMFCSENVQHQQQHYNNNGTVSTKLHVRRIISSSNYSPLMS